MYKTPIRIMSRYVARKYENGDNIKMILKELKIPTLEKPVDLNSMADDVDKDIYIEDVKEYARDNCALTRSYKNLYSLVLGQCNEILRAKMKEKGDWKKIDKRITQWSF